MLLTVYLLLARKREKRQVSQTDTSAGVSRTRGSKLFHGKVSPIVTTTKKRPRHFATYGSGRLLLQSAHAAFARALLETMFLPPPPPPARWERKASRPSLAFSSSFKIPCNRGHFPPARTSTGLGRNFPRASLDERVSARDERARSRPASSHPLARRYTSRTKPACCTCLSPPMNSKRRLRAERSDRRSVFTSARICGDCARPFHRPFEFPDLAARSRA